MKLCVIIILYIFPKSCKFFSFIYFHHLSFPCYRIAPVLGCFVLMSIILLYCNFLVKYFFIFMQIFIFFYCFLRKIGQIKKGHRLLFDLLIPSTLGKRITLKVMKKATKKAAFNIIVFLIL